MEKNCFICTESCNNLSPCKCKNLYVHEECLLKSIYALNKTKCTICLSEYKDLVSTQKMNYGINMYYVMLVVLCITLLMFIYATILSISESRVLLFIIFFFTMINSVLLSRIVGYLYYNRPAFWVGKKQLKMVYFTRAV